MFSFSFSLPLSESGPTNRSFASSFPVRIAFCKVRAVAAGTTAAPKEVDGDEVVAPYEDAKRVALNRDIDGFSCLETGISREVS